MGLAFFVIALSLFPFGVGASPDILARIGAGVVWVVALLAVLLTLDRLWQADYEDGSLELILLAPGAARAAGGGQVPGALADQRPAPGRGLAAPGAADEPAGRGSVGACRWRCCSARPTLTLVGSIGAALLLGSRRGSVLMALLVLPLYIPVLIFGVAAVEGEMLGLGGTAPLLILAAMLLLALALTPFATAAALRLALE